MDVQTDGGREDGISGPQKNIIQQGADMDRISGIVVVIAAFCIQVLVFGTSNSIGVYNIQILKAFESGAAAVSLIGSINLGMLLGAGPVSSVLLTKMSHRRVALFGAVLSSIGLMCMPFAPNLPYMYFFYGIMAGLGFSLVYIPSFVLSGLFYDKHRSLATGIVSAGAGLGSTLFPNIFHTFIEFYGWRGSLGIVAGINLHLFVFAALMRPAPPTNDSDIVYIDRDRTTSQICEDDNRYPPSNNNHLTRATSEMGLPKVVENAPPKEPSDELTLRANTNKDSAVANDVAFEEIKLSSATSIERKRIRNHGFRQQLKLVITFDFLIYIISNLGSSAGGGILLIFLPKYMTSVGLSEGQASLAFSLFGAVRCVGSIIGGFLGSSSCCNRFYVYIISHVGAGLVILAYNVSAFNSLFGQICLITLFGFFFGIFLSLHVSLTCDLISKDALSLGIGLLMLSNGVGMFAGPPIGGALIDYTESELAGIALSGAFAIFGGLVMTVVPIRRKTCRRSIRTIPVT